MGERENKTIDWVAQNERMTSFSLQWYRISFRFSNKCKSFSTDIRYHHKSWIKRNTQSSGFVLHCALVEYSANSAGYCGVCFVREFLIANKASHPTAFFSCSFLATNECYTQKYATKKNRQTKIYCETWTWTFKSIFFDNMLVPLLKMHLPNPMNLTSFY